MAKYLFNASLRLNNGEYVAGPITINENSEYLFRNTNTDLDLYFSIKKDEKLNWQLSNGPSYEVPSALIKQLGNIIDYKQTGDDVIEVFADGILPKFVPDDDSIKEIYFEFYMEPSLNLRVFYLKTADSEGNMVWRFQRSQLLLAHLYKVD